MFGGRIVMAHRRNEKFCQQLSELLREKYPQADIRIIPTSGLCSFYAEEAAPHGIRNQLMNLTRDVINHLLFFMVQYFYETF